MGNRCGHCQTEKDESEFAPSQRHTGAWCRQCFRDEYRKANPATPPRPCEWCGTVIENPLPKSRFCSSECKTRQYNAAKAKRTATAKLDRKCEACGASVAKMRGNARVCSTRCANALRVTEGRMTPEMRRVAVLRQYALTPATFDALLVSQDHRCAICRTDTPGKKGWAVDHCHTGGQVRGLLCGSCNVGLGQFKDDPVRLQAAIEYLA